VKLIRPADNRSPTEQTLATDPGRTRVWFVEGNYKEKTANGKFRTVVKRRRGSLAELKVGQVAEVTEVNGVATQIQVQLPTPEEEAPGEPGEEKQAERSVGETKQGERE
jgi:hypothetical protein